MFFACSASPFGCLLRQMFHSENIFDTQATKFRSQMCHCAFHSLYFNIDGDVDQINVDVFVLYMCAGMCSDTWQSIVEVKRKET